MSEIGNRVYEDLIARGKSKSTASQWRGWTDRLAEVAGDKEEYDRADLIKYLADCRERGATQNSINTMMRPMRLVWQILDIKAKTGLEFPKLAMPKVKATDVTRTIFSYEDVVKLITEGRKALSKRRLAFLVLATVYGLRREEMTNLTNEDLNSGNHLTVRTVKGGPVTVHVIPEEVREYLRAFEPTDVRYMSRIFNAMLKDCGFGDMEGYGWHSIRRSLVTELVIKDVSALNIVRFMRWSDSSVKGELGMLIIYAKKNQDAVDEEVFKAHPFLSLWR